MTRGRAASARIRPAEKANKAERSRQVRPPNSRPGGPATTSRPSLRARQHAAIAALGERALAGLKPAALFDAAVRALSEGLDVEFAKVLELTGDGSHLLMRAGVGWQQGMVGEHTVSVDDDSQARFTLHADRPIIVADVARETRFVRPAMLLQHGIVSGMSVVIRGRDGPFGVLGVHSARRRRFSADDASVLASAANILGMALDRDRAETQLRESESRLRAFFDHSPSLLNLRTPDGRYLMVNRRYRDLFGVSPQQIIGKTSTELHAGEHGARSQEAVMRVVRSRKPLVYEEETPTQQGPRRFVTTRFPIFGSDGEVTAVGTIAPEVTALREAETELRHYRDLLEGVTDTIPVTIAYVGADGVYRWINRRGAERLGRPREAIIGKSMRELWGDRYWKEMLAARVQRVLAGETLTYERMLERPHGATLQIETHLTPALGPDGAIEGFCVLTVDITERTRTTHALARSVSMLQATLESTVDGVLVVDECGRMTACNRQFLHLWGIAEAGRAEQDGAFLLAQMRERLRDPGSFVNDAQELYAKVHVELVQLLDFRDARLIECHSKPQLIDAVPVGRVWNFRDVTERQRGREALQRTNEDLEARVSDRTSQLAAAHREAETLSYSIAHDLRAPLRAISGYARILLDDMAAQLPKAGADLLVRVGINAERMGNLIDALLGFGQLSRQPLQPATLRLDEVVDDALGWMQSELTGRSIEIERTELGVVRADPALIRIALANLLSNAIKFSRGRDPARIEIGRTRMAEETVYYVRDNGAGFDMRYADKLFGMFQRLHGHGRFEGSGVGLASVQQIVHRHGGRVWAESSEDNGATFYFTLGT